MPQVEEAEYDPPREDQNKVGIHENKKRKRGYGHPKLNFQLSEERRPSSGARRHDAHGESKIQ